MHNALILGRRLEARRASGQQHSTISISGTSVVQVLCDSDLGTSVRGLDHIRVGRRDWLLVDLAPVRSASPFTCSALIAALDRLSPDRFCVVAPNTPPWIGMMLPRRAGHVTFRSTGDALQMLVFAIEGLDAGWMRPATVPTFAGAVAAGR